MSLSSMSSYLEFHEMHSDSVAGREAMRTSHKKPSVKGRAPSPVPEAWTNEIVWATQRGDYGRCLQLIKAGYDVKKCEMCHVCDRCVDGFDHHCQWLGNCVGRRNHKHFVEYLFSVTLMCALFLLGSMGFLNANCGTELGFLSILSCEPWVTFMGLLAATGGCWVTVVLVVQLYRILWQGKTRTTREGFGTEVGSGSRPSLQPNPGVVRNFIDFFELEYLDCRSCSCFF